MKTYIQPNSYSVIVIEKLMEGPSGTHEEIGGPQLAPGRMVNDAEENQENAASVNSRYRHNLWGE